MKIKLLLFFFLILLFFNVISAWGSEAHVRFCPDSSINCNIADQGDFQRNNPYAETRHHLCYDNKEDCISRLTAEYFLKKYYVEGQNNKELLGAAVHLYQDSFCPQHWYPGFRILGNDVYLFAPRGIKGLEMNIDNRLKNNEQDWGFSLDSKKHEINVNLEYLENMKEEISEIISKEPEQSLEEIEAKIKSKKITSYLRAYKGMMIILAIILFPVIIYYIWKYVKKKRKR